MNIEKERAYLSNKGKLLCIFTKEKTTFYSSQTGGKYWEFENCTSVEVKEKNKKEKKEEGGIMSIFRSTVYTI
jgi:hypothetical protein